MKRTQFVATALAVALLAAPAWAEKILVLSSGDPLANAAVSGVLTQAGDSVVIGPTFNNFTGAGLSGYNDVILMPGGAENTNYNSFRMGDMPTSGQQALVNFVSGGGGLVTGEYVMLKYLAIAADAPNYQTDFHTLVPILPMSPNNINTGNTSIAFGVTTANSVIDAHLPSSFTFNANNAGGSTTEAYYQPKPGATAYFNTNQWTSTFGGEGVAYGAVGWNYGMGRVFSISTPIDATTMGNLNFAQLVTNAVNWTSGNGSSPPVIPPVWGANPPIDPAPIPEPAAVIVWGVGLAGALAMRLRRSRRARSIA